MRIPWAPLNLGAFLIILGGFLLLSFIGVVTLSAAFPLVFTIFGAWLALLAIVIPSGNNPYGAPRPMVLGWGALLAGLGILWYVGFNAGEFLPVTFAVLIIITGIAAVGYSLMRAQPKKPSAAVA
jgi:hypothetical protein